MLTLLFLPDFFVVYCFAFMCCLNLFTYLLTFIYFSMVQYKVFKPYGHRNGHIIYTHSTSDCKVQFKSVD